MDTIAFVFTVLRTFANGTRDIEIAPGVEVGVRADGWIYWATPEGWDWVIDNARRTSVRVLGDSTGWPTTWHDDHYLDLPAAV